MSRHAFNSVAQGFPSYRVFIFGYEVTSDCVDLNSVWTNGRAPSFINLTLLNPNDRYIIRRDDMVALYPDKMKAYASRVPNSDLSVTYDQVINQRQIFLDSVSDPKSIKSQITALKRKSVFSVPAESKDPFTGQALPKTSLPIYPFVEGKSIFHQNDPVRVFVQDPFDPPVWYYWFSGSITQISDGVLPDNLEKTLTLQCEDASKSLRYGRYTTNPGFRDPVGIDTEEDLKKRSVFTTALTGKSFQEAADFVVFGDVVREVPPESALIPVSVVNRKNTGKTFYRKLLKTAAGNFKPLALTDRIFTLAKSTNSQRSTITLQDWQNVILDHKVKIEDIAQLRARSDNPEPIEAITKRLQDQVTQAQANGDFTASLTQQIISEIGGDPSNYPVDGGTLYMLLPEGLGKLGEDVVAREFVSSFSMISEFKDRRSLMYDLVSRVEFCFYADPKGNLIIEFPLFDFDPDDFADRASRSKIIPATDDMAASNSMKFTVRNQDGTYTFDNERRFTIEDDALDKFTATDDDAPIRTIAQGNVVVSRAFSDTATNGPPQAPIRVPEIVRLDPMIAIYGPRVMHSSPRIPVETSRAAIIAAAIELNKQNSEAYTYKLPINPRFSAWLNRPMLFRHRNHIGTSAVITHQITWGVSASTTISFNYARAWAGDIDPESSKMIYVPIGGASSRPINYAELFAKNKTPNSQAPSSSSGAGTQGT